MRVKKSKEKDKKKTKRKRGKKFVYNKENSQALQAPVGPVKKINPFEAISQKKFMKIGKEVSRFSYTLKF